MLAAMQSPKHRRRLTLKETTLLNSVFQHTPAPDAMLRATLGIKLSMSSRAVQIWFQNKRAQTKRMNKENSGASSSSGDGLHVTELTVNTQQISPVKSPATDHASYMQFVRKPATILPKSGHLTDDKTINTIRSLLYPSEDNNENDFFLNLKSNVLITVLMQDKDFEHFMNSMGRELRININRFMELCSDVLNSDIPNEKSLVLKLLLTEKLKDITHLTSQCEQVFDKIEHCVFKKRCESCAYCKFWKDCTQIPFVHKTRKYCVEYLSRLYEIIENIQ